MSTFENTMRHLQGGATRDGEGLLVAMIEDLGAPPEVWSEDGPEWALSKFSASEEGSLFKPFEDLHWRERANLHAWYQTRDPGTQGTELGTPYDLAYVDIELTSGKAVNLPSPRLTDVRDRMLSVLIGERAEVMGRLRRDLVLFVTVWGTGYERAELYVVGSASTGDEDAGKPPGVHVKRLPFHKSTDAVDHDRHLQLVSRLDAKPGDESWRSAFDHSFDTLSAIRDHFRGKMRDALLELMKLLDARSSVKSTKAPELRRLREAGTLLVFRLMFLLEVERRRLLYTERVEQKALTELMADLASGDPEAKPGAILARVRALTLAIRDASNPTLALRGASIFSNRPNHGFDVDELTPWLDPLDDMNLGEISPGELARWDAALLEAGAVATGQLDAKIHLSNDRMGAGGAEHTHRILGDVYEQILAYVPARNKQGELILKLKGGKKDERSALGAHYTPPELVNEIVRPALGRLFAARWEASGGDIGRYVTALLALKVCDPAMGSAHFLTVAALEIAREIAWVRCNGAPRPSQWHEPMLHPNPIGENPPTFDPDAREDGSVFAPLVDAEYGGGGEAAAYNAEVARWVPDVVQQCIYGVDVNALACELGKLSLWLFTLTVQEDQRPQLTFLDGNIKCGSSLVGVTYAQAREILSDRLGQELPEAAAMGELTRQESTEDILRRITEYQRIMRLDEPQLREQVGGLGLGDLDARQAPVITLRRACFDLAATETQKVRWIFDLAVLLVFFNARSQKNGLSGLVAALRAVDDTLPEEAKDPEHPIWKALIKASMVTGDQDILNLRTALARLAGRLETGGGYQATLHWEVEFPSVFHDDDTSRNGFDAIVANPPFVGDRKLKGFAGADMLEYLKAIYTNGSVTDLCGFFLMRFDELVHKHGVFSTIGPNTIAQAKNRREAILPLISGKKPKFSIVRARRSERWPGEAAVFVCTILAARDGRDDEIFARWSETKLIDETLELPISSYLDEYPESGWKVLPSMSANLVYTGHYLRGDFSLRSDQPTLTSAIATVPVGERSSLFAYLNNQELQQQPRPVPSRIVIDFFDDLQAANLTDASPRAGESQEEANTRLAQEQYDWLQEHRPNLLNVLEAPNENNPSVRQMREALIKEQKDGSFAPSAKDKPHVQFWWLFAYPRINLKERSKGLSHVTAFGRVSKVWSPSFLPLDEPSTGLKLCPTDQLNISPNQSRAFFGTLSSFVFEAHMRREASTIKTDVRVTPTDSIPVFPVPWDPQWDVVEGRPTITNVPQNTEDAIGAVVEDLLEHRQAILDDPDAHHIDDKDRTSRWGPTELYNLYDDPECELESIEELRRLHRELLDVILEQYRWGEELGEVGWGFDVPWIDRTWRYVPVLPVRQRLFELLSELNARRYADEIAMYLTRVHALMTPGKKYSFNALKKLLKEPGSGVDISDDDLKAVLDAGHRRRRNERIVRDQKGKHVRPKS